MNDRLRDKSNIWLGLAGVLVTGGIALVIAGHLVELAAGSFLIAGGVALFGLLLLQRTPEQQLPEVRPPTGSDGFNLSQVFRGPGHLAESYGGLPEFKLPPPYESAEAEMHQLAPTNWLISPDGDSEVFLRAAAALPGITASRYSGEPATVLRGETREAFLVETLTDAPLTQWLRALCRRWNCPDDAEWKPHGAGQPDLTQLLLRPIGARGESLMARFGVLTGWRVAGTTVVPAIRCVCDLLMNVSALDSERRLDPDRNADPRARTTGPLPAALSPTELAEYMVALLDVAPLAQEIGKELLPEGDFSKGAVGLWISCSGIQLQNLVDLQGLRRIEGAYDSGSEARVSPWPFAEGAPFDLENRKFVADFLDTVLERGGYRGVKDLFDPIRHTA